MHNKLIGTVEQKFQQLRKIMKSTKNCKCCDFFFSNKIIFPPFSYNDKSEYTNQWKKKNPIGFNKRSFLPSFLPALHTSERVQREKKRMDKNLLILIRQTGTRNGQTNKQEALP